MVLLVTAFVFSKDDTDLSDEGADGGGDDESEKQRRAGGGSGSTVYKKAPNQDSTQTSGMTPPGVVPLGSTLVPQTAVAAAPKPVVATPRTPAVAAPPKPVLATTPKPVLATTPKPAAAARRTSVVATTPKPAAAAPPTPVAATTPKPAAAAPPTPVAATTPKPAAAAPRTPVVATTPKTAAAAPPTPAVATTPKPVLATTPKPVLATTPKPSAAAPPTPAVVMPPTPARKPPTPMRAPSTTTVLPKPPIAGQTTRPAPTTQAPLPKGSLLCTLRAGFKRSNYTFPPDGLCTIITFDSVYRGGYTLAPPYKEDFQYFLDTSMQAKYSEFGIGIEQETCTNRVTMRQLTSNVSTKMYLDDLWDRYRIYHYGQVSGSISFKNLAPSVASRLAATGLQMIAGIMNDKKDAKLRPSYTILHNWLMNTGNARYIGEALSEVPVDIFVIVVHHDEPDINFATCRMVPPTILTADVLEDLLQDGFYGIRMGSSISHLAANHHHWPPNMMYAVSLGMAGRWYAPRDKGSMTSSGPIDYGLGEKCGGACKKGKLLREHQITEIAQACSRPTINNTFYRDRLFHALVTYDVVAELVFTYDSPRNLPTKLCKAKTNATNVEYTFAPADIQLEDAHGSCGYGPFPRLYMLKKLAAFFAYNYTSAGRERECRAVTY
ncbi:uncharacterized protein LOC142578042 [Dermacentor variabilis]|uniref:uncharacterized protein LOC142578042 n=1 Tax=Dermacentor variabilis TaxID=34621 RepID=UPI003F5BB787